MSGPPVDALELLLPDAPPQRAAAARRLATFLRLLADDARHPTGATVRVNLDRARLELEGQTRARLERALGELLRLHLVAGLGPEAFLLSEQVERSTQPAWSVLAEAREDDSAVPEVPGPGEAPLAVARRLLSFGERLALPRPQLDLWRAWLERAEHGPQQGEQALRALLDDAQVAHSSEHAVLALTGVLEICLERGAVRAARDLLEARSASPVGARRSHRRLDQLRAWVGLLLGEPGTADPHPSPRFAGRLPAALAELRERRPEWLPWLAGAAPGPATAHGEDRSPPAMRRADFGAALLAVFRRSPEGSTQCELLDASPAWRERAREWARGRDGACEEPDQPEHSMAGSARPVLSHGTAKAGLRGVVAPDQVAAAAWAPIQGLDGSLQGWLHLAFEHHLLPARARLLREASAWGRRFAESSPKAPGSTTEAAVELEREIDPLAAVFDELVAALGLKLSRRHWWAFEVGDHGTRRVAEGGCPWRSATRDEGRAMARALACGGAVSYEESGSEQALHADAASGVALPLRARGRAVGLLVIESTRRRDFQDLDLAARTPLLAEFGLRVAIARFRRWHLEQHGHDVLFGVGPGALSSRVEDLLAAGRARTPVAVTGPPGCGKEVLARWLHFEGGAELPWRVLRCSPARASVLSAGTPGSDPAWERLATGPGTLLLDGVDRLAATAQAELAERLGALAAEPEGPRLVITAARSLAEGAGEGTLDPDLDRLFRRLELEVPPLCERRDEIPALAVLLGERFAGEQGLRAPGWTDDALALLWRQPWAGNVRELEDWVFKLVLLGPGATLSAADVEELARRFRLAPCRRLPSRHPRAEDLRSALWTTRTGRGTANKTRAALYLGWDPDTLVQRMKEAGIDGPGGVRTG